MASELVISKGVVWLGSVPLNLTEIRIPYPDEGTPWDPMFDPEQRAKNTANWLFPLEPTVKMTGGGFALDNLLVSFQGPPGNLNLCHVLVDSLLLKGRLLPMLVGNEVKVFTVDEADAPLMVRRP